MVLSMDRWVGKVAVVTGASSGIGTAISKKLVEEGVIVVGLARRNERVEELAKKLAHNKGKLYAFKADISIEDDIKKAFKWTLDTLGPVHILVNNAGIHYRTSLLEENTDLFRNTFDVNVLGLIIATREAINIMKKHNIDGHIVHINSVLGHSICTHVKLDVYPATKYGVTALTETLRLELGLIKSKIKVSSVSPGAVDTEIFDSMRGTEQFKAFEDTMLKAEDIADGVIYILSTPPHVQVHELTIKPVGEKF